MQTVSTRLPDVCLVEPRIFKDERGWFFEEFHDEKFAALGLPTHFRQENRSHSRRNVVRGFHFQLTRPQGKLVTCLHGSIFDVAVDIRRGSPTFGEWVGVELHGSAPRQFWIPPGFAHGFCVLSETADVSYKCTEIYIPDDERGILWNDPAIGIDWPVTAPVVSSRDAAFPGLREAPDNLPLFGSTPK